MKITKVSIYSKLLILIVFSSVSFVILFLSLYYVVNKQESEVYSKAHTQYKGEINSLLKLNSEFIIQNLKDKTFWDDLVNFVNTNDEKWFNDLVEPTLGLYDLDYVGIYKPNRYLVRSMSNGVFKSIPKISKELKEKLDQDKFVHFYNKYPEGITEVFIATIHPTNDPKRITTPQGYYYVIRLIDADYLNKLEKTSSSEINLSNNLKIKKYDGSCIQNDIHLKDFEGNVVSNLIFKRHFILNYNQSNTLLNIILFVVFVNIAIYIFFIKRWISYPLAVLKKILKLGNPEDIEELKNAPGEFGIVGYLIEESEQQKIELLHAKEKAEESDKLKSAFLANLSHEIRTPMNAIIGFTDLIKENNLTQEEKNSFIDVVKKSGRNLISIIDDLIEMSKIDSNQVKPKLREFDIVKHINELYQALKVTLPKEKDIEFILASNHTKKSIFVKSDDVKLSQIITNLVTNAIKFTAKGTIILGYNIDEFNNKISIFVKDSGVGIEEKDQKMIFERFKRVENDYTIKISGIGLGLPITKAYIELLGGTINVKSEINKGTEFYFEIPIQIVEAKENATVVNLSTPIENLNSIKKYKILVAEDDNINFLLIDKLLKMKNFDVVRATNGEEAIAMCEEFDDIDIILMDIKMPRMNGFDAIKIIKQFYKAPIIAQTAYSLNEDKDKIINAGFNDFITKPIVKERLYSIIQENLNTANI